MAESMGGSEPLIAKAIHETLDSIVAPDVRDALIECALALGGLASIPSEGGELKLFVDGPLRDALVQGLGVEMAESVMEELERIARLADSERRAPRRAQLRSLTPPTPRRRLTPPRQHKPNPSPPPRRSVSPRPSTLRNLARAGTPPPYSGLTNNTPSARAPTSGLVHTGDTPKPGVASSSSAAAPLSGEVDDFSRSPTTPAPGPEVSFSYEATSQRRLVLLASRDEDLWRRLLQEFGADTEVRQVTGIAELLRTSESDEVARVVVLVDCRQPSIRPTALAGLAEELAASMQFVLWGAPPELRRALLLVSSATADWPNLSSSARADELAQRCSELVS